MTQKRLQLKEEIKSLALKIRETKLLFKESQKNNDTDYSLQNKLFQLTIEFTTKHIAASLMRGTELAKIVKWDNLGSYKNGVHTIINEYGSDHKYINLLLEIV